ncbi:hypothetical protein [Halomonas sp. CKK8]|uniref:hypothetical protein n=1 Tax=Halomonas sp. CKK8 TaxID=3036127 RepID=UPI002415718F|nr:hypothetical protein [Halomonas sp. CKK8]WFM72817.1 hypothetical protein P8934_07440 [Halomonas sp. CKK8]
MRLEKNFWRYAFFFVHFFGGFAVLFMSYYYIQILLKEELLTSVFLKSFVEVSYLVTGVVWGNVGWDRFGKFTPRCNFSELTQALVITTAPVTIIFPPIIAVSEFMVRTSEMSWKLAWYNTSLSLVWLSFISLAVLLIYKKHVAKRRKVFLGTEVDNVES